MPVLSRRAAVLAILALPFAKFDVLAAQGKHHEAATGAGGVLTVPLDLYAGIVVTYKGRRVAVSNADIFAAVSGEEI